MTTNKIDAARAHLNAALQEEGEALTSACDAATARGTSSDQAVKALRSAQGAHARSNAAASELRALFREVDGSVNIQVQDVREVIEVKRA
jgi:hypothetical protein